MLQNKVSRFAPCVNRANLMTELEVINVNRALLENFLLLQDPHLVKTAGAERFLMQPVYRHAKDVLQACLASTLAPLVPKSVSIVVPVGLVSWKDLYCVPYVLKVASPMRMVYQPVISARKGLSKMKRAARTAEFAPLALPRTSVGNQAAPFVTRASYPLLLRPFNAIRVRLGNTATCLEAPNVPIVLWGSTPQRLDPLYAHLVSVAHFSQMKA